MHPRLSRHGSKPQGRDREERVRCNAREPGTVDVPTLMIWGLEDSALGKATTDGTDRYVRDLTLRYLPGVSHWVQQEAPEKVNAMIEAWLAGAPVPIEGEIV